MSEWISVTDKLPKKRTPVLAASASRGMLIAAWYGTKAEPRWQSWWDCNNYNITHWMTLPELPPVSEATGES